MVWGAYARHPPPPPTLLASCEIADSKPNHIFCRRLHCCQLLMELAGQTGTNFNPFNSLSLTYLLGPFWVLWLNLWTVAHIWPEPHTTPYPPSPPSYPMYLIQICSQLTMITFVLGFLSVGGCMQYKPGKNSKNINTWNRTAGTKYTNAVYTDHLFHRCFLTVSAKNCILARIFFSQI